MSSPSLKNSGKSTITIVSTGTAHRITHLHRLEHRVGLWSSVGTPLDFNKRYGHSAVVSEDGTMFIFGGCDETGVFLNTLIRVHIPTKTIELLPSGPTQRHFHVAAIDSQNQMWIHGGKSNGYHNDFYKFNIGTLQWSHVVTKNPGPLARFGHSAVVFDDRLFIYGGYDQHGFCCDELYQFSFFSTLWKKVKTTKDPNCGQLERYHHSAVAFGRSMFIFGGKGPHQNCSNDLIEYHFDTHQWTVVTTSIGAAPSSRWGHSAVVMDRYMYLFGGCDGTNNFADLYQYDFGTRNWILVEVISCPSPRYFLTAIAYDNAMVISGGKNLLSQCFSDVHEFSLENSSEKKKEKKKRDSRRSSEKPKNKESRHKERESKQEIKLKCYLGEEIRIIPISRRTTYEDLIKRLNEEYPAIDPQSMVIKYTDGDGDMITVRSQSDLKMMLQFFASLSLSSPLKIFLYSSSQQVQPQSPNVSMPQNPFAVETLVGRGEVVNSYGSSMSDVESASTSLVLSSEATPMSDNIRNSNNQDDLKKPEVRWKQGELLGQGGFGRVYLGMTDRGELIAVKQVELPEGFSSLQLQSVSSLQKEIALMENLNHPNIVRYLGSEKVGNTLNILLEYVPGGSLRALLTKFQSFGEKVCRSFTKQILSGLVYLHDNGIAHRDIKGANILVDTNGIIKLADFGASQKLADIVSLTGGAFNTVAGSPYWMAPEVIQGHKYGRKADIWSLGAVVIEMMTGSPPFSDLPPVTALFRIASSDIVPPSPSMLSEEGRHFLSLCFQRDPNKRSTARELSGHSFVNVTSPSATSKDQVVYRAVTDTVSSPSSSEAMKRKQQQQAAVSPTTSKQQQQQQAPLSPKSNSQATATTTKTTQNNNNNANTNTNTYTTTSSSYNDASETDSIITYLRNSISNIVSLRDSSD